MPANGRWDLIRRVKVKEGEYKVLRGGGGVFDFTRFFVYAFCR